MKFKLRKRSGENGTEIKLSVLFSPEESQALPAVNDDPNVTLENLRSSGTECQQADHALMILRILAHQVDLWSHSQANPVIAAHIYRGVRREELKAEEAKLRKRKRRNRK